MGDWCYYNIHDINNAIDLSEEIINRGCGQRTKEDGLLIGSDTVYCSDNGLSYCIKWGPNDRIVDVISKALPDMVLKINRDFEWYESISWYEKNGEPCNAMCIPLIKHDGYPLALFRVNPKLVKERGEWYDISLPIGNVENKWITLTISKNDVLQENYQDENGQVRMRPAHVFFTQEKYTVHTKQGSQELTAVDIYNKYRASKDEYRKQMQRMVKFKKDEAIKIDHRDDYNIVVLPCSYKDSYNGELSLVVADFFIKEDDILLGEAGTSRNVIKMNMDGKKVRKMMLNKEIENMVRARLQEIEHDKKLEEPEEER